MASEVPNPKPTKTTPTKVADQEPAMAINTAPSAIENAPQAPAILAGNFETDQVPMAIPVNALAPATAKINPPCAISKLNLSRNTGTITP